MSENEMKYVIISKDKYAKSSAVLVFEDDDDRKFAIAEWKNFKWKFGWPSDLILPLIQINRVDMKAIIMVDLSLAIIDLQTGQINLVYSLDTFGQVIMEYKQMYFALTELEMLKIDFSRNQIIEVESFPEIYKSYVISGEVIEIEMIDGSKMQLMMNSFVK